MRWLICLFLLGSRCLFGSEEISASKWIAFQITSGLENRDEKTLSALISGIEARDQNIQLSPDEVSAYSLYLEKKRNFLAQQNLKGAEHWMQNLQLDGDVHVIVPLKLMYRTIKQGAGNLLTGEKGKVLVNYTITKKGDPFPEVTERQKSLLLSEVIPGVAHGMYGMYEGEVRTIYIHPDFAYKTANFDPNIALEATVELLEIFPNDCQIPPLCESLHSQEDITQKELDETNRKHHYVLGWKLWDYLRWGYHLFTKEELLSSLRESLPQLTYKGGDDQINRIHWQIYHQRIEDEYCMADCFLKNVSHDSEVKCLVPDFLYCRGKKIRAKPSLKNSYKGKITIKNKEGKILQAEQTKSFTINDTIRGLKEGLPFLFPREPATLYIHPKWAYPDIDGTLGDTLLVVDILLE